MLIRYAKPEDQPSLASIANASGVFPGALIPDMTRSFFSGEASTEIWLTFKSATEVQGFCYAVQEKMTDGTWNMLAIAVHPSRQGLGKGTAVVKHLETVLSHRSQRVLVVDTSSAAEFGGARAFYRKNGYCEEARIRDFWAAGDDKIVFWKRLTEA